MDCCCAQAKISPYLDGALSPRECDELSAHLAGCGECRTLMDQAKRLDSALATLPRPQTRPGLVAARLRIRILEGRTRLSARDRAHGRARLFGLAELAGTVRRFAPAAAVLAAGVLVGSFLGRQIVPAGSGVSVDQETDSSAQTEKTIETSFETSFGLSGVLAHPVTMSGHLSAEAGGAEQ